jgi:4-hydroxy-2-oxoheptanedioate aldolase
MNILFLKGSFEDEGLRDFEVEILSSFSRSLNISLAFKIGGCEAKTDIEKSLNFGAKCVVAPMVESAFAASKFITATDPWMELLEERNINIETITAVNSVEDILKKNHKHINGIVVGRTDLALSMGLSRDMVDSDIVMEKVEETLVAAKKYGLTTTMGGSVNTNSVPHVANMFRKNLLDRYETRKVIMKASANEGELMKNLSKAFEIETRFISRTLMNYDLGSNAARKRLESIEKRGK